MADVRYVIEVEVPTKSDAVTVAALQGVDIAPVLEERADQFTLCSDSTAIAAPGIVQRTIIAALTADFEAKHPTFNSRYNVLLKAFTNRFELMLPSTVTVSMNIGAFCPP